MSELFLVVLSLVLLLQPNQPQQEPLPLPLRRMMSEMMMMPDVVNDDDDDDDDAGVGGVEPPIPKGGAGDGVGDNSVAPLASFSSFTDDLLIRRAELLRDRRQQHPE